MEEEDDGVGGGGDGGGGDRIGGGGDGTGSHGLSHAEHIVHAIWYLEVVVIGLVVVVGVAIVRDMKREIRESFSTWVVPISKRLVV